MLSAKIFNNPLLTYLRLSYYRLTTRYLARLVSQRSREQILLLLNHKNRIIIFVSTANMKRPQRGPPCNQTNKLLQSMNASIRLSCIKTCKLIMHQLDFTTNYRRAVTASLLRVPEADDSRGRVKMHLWYI